MAARTDAPPVPAGPVYAADAPAQRETIALDGLMLVYHRRSRTTHLLASPAPELLVALGEGPADAATLTARLLAGEALEAEAAGAAQAVVAAHLLDLAAAGLVERA